MDTASQDARTGLRLLTKHVDVVEEGGAVGACGQHLVADLQGTDGQVTGVCGGDDGVRGEATAQEKRGKAVRNGARALHADRSVQQDMEGAARAGHAGIAQGGGTLTSCSAGRRTARCGVERTRGTGAGTKGQAWRGRGTQASLGGGTFTLCSAGRRTARGGGERARGTGQGERGRRGESGARRHRSAGAHSLAALQEGARHGTDVRGRAAQGQGEKDRHGEGEARRRRSAGAHSLAA